MASFLGGFIGGDPAKAYQESQARQLGLGAANADVAAEKLLGLSLPGMFQQGVPGAGPMGAQPPQQQPGMLQRLFGAFGGGQPQQPSGGVPAPPGGPSAGGPPPTSALAGTAGVTPGGGPPPIGQQALPMSRPMMGGPPMQGMPQQPPMGGQPMGGPPPDMGGLTLEKAVMGLQQGAQRDPSLADPRVFARALTKMSPLIQWQSREQLLAFREWAVGQQNLRQAIGIEAGQQKVETQQAGATQRTEMQQQGATERTTKREEGVQGRFDVREARMAAQNAIKNDQQHQTLEIRRQQLERQITQGGDRQALGQWRAIVDAQNKRAREIITSAGPTGMPEAERKKLLDEQDKFYRSQIEGMKAGGSKGDKQLTAGPVKVKTPDEATKLAPGTRYVTPDGQEYTR